MGRSVVFSAFYADFCFCSQISDYHHLNDIVNDIGSNIRLFADDTSLYIVVDDPITAANCLNTDLEKISRWAATWLVSFNPAKTESLLISRKLNRPQHPALSMQNHQINEVDSHKHLGIYLSNDCTWHEHVNYIKEKAWFRINVMRKLKFKLDRKSLEIIYTAFIRPLLEYGDVIWDNCTEYEKKIWIKYRVRLLELLREQQSSSHLVLYLMKFAGNHWNKDGKIIDLLYLIK